MKQKKLAVICGDLRQVYLANILSEKYETHVYGLNSSLLNDKIIIHTNIAETMKYTNCYFLPTPLIKNYDLISSPLYNSTITLNSFMMELSKGSIVFGGVIPKELYIFCNRKDIRILDYMKNQTISLKNAISTAEGAICEAISLSSQNLFMSNSIVLGFGKCAKVIAQKLNGLGCKVTIYARNKAQLTEASVLGYEAVPLEFLEKGIKKADFIFNTIPALILNEILLENCPKITVIIDIASNPGGINYSYCEKNHINAHLCPGLPGKYAPKSSAEILAASIFPILCERTDPYETGWN